MQTELLARLVARKHEVLTHLRSLAVRQVELVGGDDWTQLTKVLSTKQRLLDLLAQIECELKPFRSQSPDERVWASAADREACRRLADDSATLLAELMQLERDSEQTMVRRRDDAARQLALMHAATAARSAYAAEHQPASIGRDLVSEG
jgi:hypothetical protein